MRHSGLLTALVVGGTTLALPQAAHADNNNFSLHLEPGMVEPLSAPQSTIYNDGMVLSAKGMFALTPNLSVGPSLSNFYLPRAADTNENAGVLWQMGGSLRLQGDRRVSTHTPISPWIDVDMMAARTGALWRPAFDVGAGMEATMDQRHHFWLGPFIRYTHLQHTVDWQTGTQLDSHSANFMQVGLSFSFDYPTPMQPHVVVRDRVVYKPFLVFVEQPNTINQTDTVNLTEKVYFDYNSAVLRWESNDKLNALITTLNQHTNIHITVEGYSSSDGQVAYNQVLSEKRTAAVEKYLVAHGVDASRIVGYSHGVNDPAAPNSTQEGRERNRRVEFVVHFTYQE